MSWLSGTKFAVFGLGDSTYSTSAERKAIGRHLQQGMWATHLGATLSLKSSGPSIMCLQSGKEPLCLACFPSSRQRLFGFYSHL